MENTETNFSDVKDQAMNIFCNLDNLEKKNC